MWKYTKSHSTGCPSLEGKKKRVSSNQEKQIQGVWLNFWLKGQRYGKIWFIKITIPVHRPDRVAKKGRKKGFSGGVVGSTTLYPVLIECQLHVSITHQSVIFVGKQQSKFSQISSVPLCHDASGT